MVYWVSIVAVSSRSLSSIRVMQIRIGSVSGQSLQLNLVLFELSFLLVNTQFESLVLRNKHGKALFVAILDRFHLHTQVLNCLVKILYHLAKLIILHN